MLRIAIFEIVQLLVTAYAIWRGGAPERIAGVLLLSAAWGSLALPYDPRTLFHGFELAQFGVDAALFLGLLAVALRANRFWPLWIVSLQLVTLGVHGVKVYDHGIVPIVYARLTGEIAYPMCLALVLGTWRYRIRVERGGAGTSPWSQGRGASRST